MESMEEFVRVKEAAEILGVAPNTIRSWGGDGRIPEYRHPVNNYRLFRRGDLEELIAKVQSSMAPTKKKKAK